MNNKKEPKALAGEYTNEKIVKSIFKNIEKRNLKSFSVLDLGTGNGYNVWLIKKFLNQKEYKDFKVNIFCADIDESQFCLDKKDLTFYSVNFDREFKFGNFDFIIATEVVEHLEDAYKFIRNCLKILNRDGLFLFSTPNVVNIYSSIKIFFTARPYLFCDLDKHGHKTAFFPFMMDHIIKFEETENKDFKYKIKKYFNKNIIKLPFKKTINILGNNRFLGDSAIFEVEKL